MEEFYKIFIVGIFCFFIAFLLSYLSLPRLIRKLMAIGMTGKDLNKKKKYEVAEMGGLAIVAGLFSGIILFLGIEIYFPQIFGKYILPNVNLTLILAALSTILIITLIGIFDDLFDLNHSKKAVLPIFASLPLVFIAFQNTSLNIPFIGSINFGIFYALILVPIAITACSNMTNMLAGFNGMEAGMGLVMSLALSAIALKISTPESFISFILLISLAGALVAFLKYNWYPAKIFPGDTGNLTIGVVIASAVIIGNFELAGLIVMIPYIIDFFIKLKNKLPTEGWQGEYNNGKLYVPKGKHPISFAQWIMKISNGISEKNLTLSFITIELIFSIIAIIYYFGLFYF